MEQRIEKEPELVSLKLPTEFITDFVEFWGKVKRIVKSERKTKGSWKKWNEISLNMMETSTRPFYDKWKNTGRVLWIKQYIKTFSSITLQIKGDSVLIPHRLILYESINPGNSLFLRLQEDPSMRNLERIMVSLYDDLNLRLLTSDLQILQKLAQPGFSKSLERYPTLKELAYSTRRDVRTVSNRLEFLFYHQILVQIYLVDMARIGYQTILIFHQKERSEISKDIEPYIVMSFPLSTQGGFSTILQYPYRDIEAYKTLIDYFDRKENGVLKAQYCGWNLSGLTRDPSGRWNVLPPLLQEGENWSTRVIVGETGVEFNLDPYYDPFPITYRQGQLLGLIHKLSTMEEDLLAKQLKVGRGYITADVKELLKNRVILRFPLFFNLGLGSWIYFRIDELTTSRAGGLMNVIEHLKFFPYVNVFYNLDDGNIIGRVNIPPAWTTRFIFSLTSLPKIFNCSLYYYIGPESHAPWAFDILGTFDWDQFPYR
ncbi:MAG: hypothetical protein JSV04_15130 [Candidatus Heimdallarchaeota archaeon]|nr:MAG: hypothetical protein JSV04_15130 [Candidatus Heimdallarchaeota archaeon]